MEPRIRTDACTVLVIGSGAAGMRAAIAAHEAGEHVRVVGKRQRLDAHTVLASGGINGALGTRDPQDTWQQHFADTVREGYFLSDPAVVEVMASEAPRTILELAEWGCQFARTEEGALDQRFFGAHRWRRTCYAGDYTGRAILQTLHRQADAVGVPAVLEDEYVARLLVADGVCFGALSFDLHTGEQFVHYADAVILCTGGHTRLWRRSSSRRDENYGEGWGLALREGCRVMDPELVQFHPTGMVAPEEIAGTLVTEAVRGEGGRLFNSNGERFMERYDADRLELSSRDRVALANYTEISEGRGGPNGGVFLDISHRGKDYILEKLPRMYRQFVDHQMLDISKDPMEVAPTAHYSMGGLVVDPESYQTDVAGLFAAGEVTGGLHGANRLGGNSLAEAVNAGRRAGESAAIYVRSHDNVVRSSDTVNKATDELASCIKPGPELPRQLQRRLRNVMWENCGVVRNEKGLAEALDGLADIRAASDEADVRPGAEGWTDLANLLDLRAGLVAAEATVRGALERKETRGAHNRSDFPDLDPSLQVNFHASFSSGRIELTSEPVPAIPSELEGVVGEPIELSLADRLLE